MSSDIFREYLHWFNGNVCRKVVLLIDNFSAHQSGWDIIIAEDGYSMLALYFCQSMLSAYASRWIRVL